MVDEFRVGSKQTGYSTKFVLWIALCMYSVVHQKCANFVF